jgi:hypothetical protein
LASAAVIVWDFNPANVTGAVGAATETLHGSATGLNPLDPTTPLVTVSGFDANNAAHDLYWKVSGTDEHGIGLTGTTDNELTLNSNGTAFANYLQINVTNILAAGGTSLDIRVQSVTAGEEFDLYGSNSPNVLGTKIISGSTVNNLLTPIPEGAGYFDYYFVTVTPQGSGGTHALDNVLPDAISADVPATPEPATLGLLALGGLGLLKRRRVC